jgi:hypothetical protein
MASDGRRLFLVSVAFVLAVRVGSSSPIITLLAAVPTPQGPAHFPAYAYSIDERTRRLHLVRQIVSADEGVDFVRSYRDVITVGVPNVTVQELRIIHGAQPAKVDNVALPN